MLGCDRVVGGSNDGRVQCNVAGFGKRKWEMFRI